jgi:flavin-dependent dehydrogenase
MVTNKFDVLVIGGGPAGTTFGSLMKMRGWNVALLEKDRHPRFHIGESLLPMNLPILERLGVLDRVKAIGVPKLGADFTVANSGAPHQTFHFREALGDSPPHAFEVRRSEFDHVLLENSRQLGVHVREGMCVTAVERDSTGQFLVEARDESGEFHRWESRFLLDASGRDTFFAKANGWKHRNPRHASAAVFSHFKGVQRRPGEDAGNISIYWFEHGWIWMIPLRDGAMSIGAVSLPEHLKTRRGSLDEFLLDTLHGLQEIRERMQGAELLMPAQATGNYTYLSSQMSGPGYLIVGDAFAFIDPVFSSGVYLAMDSAERGTLVAEAWLQGSRYAFWQASRQYRKETRRAISTFSWFIYRFTSPAMSFLMSNPRNVLKVVQAVISMLAGDVYANPEVRRRLLVFKTIYSISWLLRWQDSLKFRKLRLASIRAENRA